jgi:DNA-binding winged helix-turn-helix (wHTH) protein
VHLDRLTGILTIGNEQIKLGPVVGRLLEALIIADGRPLTSEALCEYIWPYSGGPDSGINDVTAHLWRLKQKLAKWPKVIETRPGFGHRLTIPASITPRRLSNHLPRSSAKFDENYPLSH